MKTWVNKISGYFEEKAIDETKKINHSSATLSQLLPYQSFDEATDIFYQTNTQGFIMEVNLLCGGMDETYQLLSHFISQQLPENVAMEILLFANPSIEQQSIAFQSIRQNEMTKLLAQKRFDYFLSSTWNSLYPGQSFLIRHFELFIMISFPIEEKTASVIQLRSELKNTIAGIGMNCRNVSVSRFLNLIKSIIQPKKSTNNTWQKYTALNEQLVSLDTEVEVFPEKIHIKNNDISIQTFSIQNYPTQWAGIAMGECLGSLLRETLIMPSPFYLHWILKPLNKERAKKRALVKTLRSDQLANSSLAKLMPRARKIAADWQEALHAIEEGGALVELFFQVVLMSSSVDENKAATHMQNLWQSLGFEVTLDRYLQLPLWLSSLPFMVAEIYYPDLKRLKRFKTLLSSNAAHLMPIQGEFKGGQSPCLPLIGRRGQLFFFDPFENTSGNFNTAIAGKSGSGKSVLMQELMTGLLGLGSKIFVLDVGRSFEKACLLHGGEFIAFDLNNPICLNPFTHIQSLTESLSMLKPLIAAMCSHQRKTTDYENAMIEKAILSAWEQKGRNTTITAIANYLLSAADPRSQDLGTMLFPYTRDGMYGHFFEGACSIDFSNALIVLELDELKSKKDLQQIVLMLLMVHVVDAMYRGNRNTRVACIIDEAWDLLRGELAGEIMETGCRRARKYKGAFITGTQSINDFYQNAASQAAIENSDHLLLLAQKEEAIEQLDKHKTLSMNDSMKILLKSLKTKKGKYSEVLLKTPQGFCVARLCLDPFSRTLYSSTAEVIANLNHLREEGVSLLDAVEQLQGLES